MTMNIEALQLPYLLGNCDITLICTRRHEDRTVDYTYRIKLKGLRSKSPLGRIQIDRFLIYVHADGERILHYAAVNRSVASSAIWSWLTQGMGRQKTMEFIRITFGVARRYAIRSKLLTYEGRVFKVGAYGV